MNIHQLQKAFKDENNKFVEQVQNIIQIISS